MGYRHAYHDHDRIRSKPSSHVLLQVVLLLTSAVIYSAPYPIRQQHHRVTKLTTPASTTRSMMTTKPMSRTTFLKHIIQVGQIALLIGGIGTGTPNVAYAFTSSSRPRSASQRVTDRTAVATNMVVSSSGSSVVDNEATTTTLSSGINPIKKSTVIYQPIELSMNEFDVSIPIACWFPTTSAVDENEVTAGNEASHDDKVMYQHRISVRRIGQLLAGWNFIPEFVSKNYSLEPASTNSNTINVLQRQQETTTVSLDRIVTNAPVIFLAHGYLGSRFDLSHLAEELSSMGYICIAAEYPESLAASYERLEGLDRSTINTALLKSIETNHKQWNNIQPTAYGIVGHSLGCGTALQMGNDQWTRVLIAGFPKTRDGIPVAGNNLFITSMNDSMARSSINPSVIADCNYNLISEQELINDQGTNKPIPRRAAILFDRPDAPNHISYLSEGVNSAMIEFLSPLLPLAQALSIPVLDFDKYKDSRDSSQTASIVHPLIIRYLQQELMTQQR